MRNYYLLKNKLKSAGGTGIIQAAKSGTSRFFRRMESELPGDEKEVHAGRGEVIRELFL